MPAGQLAVPSAAPGGALALNTGGGGGGGGGLTASDVLRVIRQNLLLIVLAVIAGGICGYYINKYLAANYPRYKTYGFIMVRSPSELLEPGGKETILRPEEIELLKETHARTIMHEALFKEALDTPGTGDTIRGTAWFKSFEDEADPMAGRKKNLRENLVATPIARSRLIQVEMTTPVREDSKTIIESLIEVFIERVSKEQKDSERKSIELLSKESKLLQNELDQQVSAQIAAWSETSARTMSRSTASGTASACSLTSSFRSRPASSVRWPATKSCSTACKATCATVARRPKCRTCSAATVAT